jgi:hypothetical protein
MSQINVERVIGLLATDEALRHRFIADPRSTLLELIERGTELTACEQWALARLNPQELARFARAIDDRLQKSDLQGGVR